MINMRRKKMHKRVKEVKQDLLTYTVIERRIKKERRDKEKEKPRQMTRRLI